MTELPSSPLTNAANPSLSHPGVLLATWFGSGYLPKAPGTWGSLFALPFAWGLVHYFGSWSLLAASLFVFCVGIGVANVYMRLSGSHDPGPVVIDEVVGQWLTVVSVPTELSYYIVGFILFRLADIFKPWPANWADRKIAGGLGVMVDDVVAAVYSGGALYVLYQMDVF
ncbi:MAG: phosphatidylglycerophosphatase A [Rhodospirillales bacterium]|nr:phosphatidylglycerophosphatase A [Rhodospirillales bacterium]